MTDPVRSAVSADVRRRRGRLVPLLLLGLIVVGVVEVGLLVLVAHQIGVLALVGILVVEALLGAWLMRREGGRAFRALNEAFATGRMPARELSDAGLVLVGSALLVLPGFVTDLLGLLCLLPFARPVARRGLGWLVTRRLSRLGATLPPRYGPGTVIEGETVDLPQEPGAGGGPNDSAGVICGEIEEPRRDDRRS